LDEDFSLPGEQAVFAQLPPLEELPPKAAGLEESSFFNRRGLLPWFSVRVDSEAHKDPVNIAFLT
jgi:hypothetical protein